MVLFEKSSVISILEKRVGFVNQIGHLIGLFGDCYALYHRTEALSTLIEKIKTYFNEIWFEGDVISPNP